MTPDRARPRGRAAVARARRACPAPSPHPAVQAAVVEVGGGAVDLAARQASGAQRIDLRFLQSIIRQEMSILSAIWAIRSIGFS